MVDQDIFVLAFLDFLRSDRSSADCAKLSEALKRYVNKKIYHKYKSHTDTVVQSSITSLLELFKNQKNAPSDDSISATLTKEFLKIISNKINKCKNDNCHTQMLEGYDQSIPDNDDDNDDDNTERLRVRSILDNLIADMKVVLGDISTNDPKMDKVVKILTFRTQGLTYPEIAKQLGEKPDMVRKIFDRFFKKPTPEIVESFEKIQSQLFYGSTFKEFARKIDDKMTSSIDGFKKLFDEKDLMILCYTIDELDSEQILKKINEEYGIRITETELAAIQTQIKTRLENFFRKNKDKDKEINHG